MSPNGHRLAGRIPGRVDGVLGVLAGGRLAQAVLLVAVAAGCAPLALGCTRAAPAPESALLVGRPSDAIGLDPARITDSESAEVCEQIYEHLVRANWKTGAIEPALATHWDVSTDGTQWTFHLRPNVRFHDGTGFDADAVVYSFERQRDPRHPGHLDDFAFEGFFRNVVRVEKLDPLTVRIAIEEAYAPFLANLATFPMSIVSPTAATLLGEEFRFHPVGTGPFRFVEWSRGERITLESNADYWGGQPRLRHLAFVPVRDNRQRLVALEGHAIDVAEGIAPQDLQFVALHPELTEDKIAGQNVGYLAMNTSRPPFSDERVRRAVSLAINQTPIVKLVYQGLAVPATGPLPPTIWGHIELPPKAYDPVRARALLDEAGYQTPRDRTRRPRLYAMSTSRPYMPAPDQVARMIAQDLHAIGMDVEVVVSDFKTHLRAVTNGEHDLCLLGWSADNGDPDNLLYTMFHSDNIVRGAASNVSFFRDGELDGNLRWAQETLDRGHRERLYAQAQRLIAEKVPMVPLAHSEVVVARRRDVLGLRLPPSSLLYFNDVVVDPR